MQDIQLGELKNRVMDTVQQKLTGRPANAAGGGGATTDGVPDAAVDQRQVHIGLGDAHSQDMVTDVAGSAAGGATAQTATEPSPYVPRGVPGQAGNMPQWITVMRMFAPIRYSSMLFVLWFMGFGIGLVFSFLFWHLQDIGGTPTLFGFASVVNHLSELLAYFYIQRVVSKIGQCCCRLICAIWRLKGTREARCSVKVNPVRIRVTSKTNEDFLIQRYVYDKKITKIRSVFRRQMPYLAMLKTSSKKILDPDLEADDLQKCSSLFTITDAALVKFL